MSVWLGVLAFVVAFSTMWIISDWIEKWLWTGKWPWEEKRKEIR